MIYSKYDLGRQLLPIAYVNSLWFTARKREIGGEMSSLS